MCQFPFNKIITYLQSTLAVGHAFIFVECQQQKHGYPSDTVYTQCLLHTSQVAEALWPLFDLYILMSRWVLRNGVNYKGLYGNLRTCFGVESKGHELNKNCLPCLLDLLPVFVRHILAILVRFQWVLKGLLNIFLALYPAIYVPKRLVTSVAIVFVATSTMRSV